MTRQFYRGSSPYRWSLLLSIAFLGGVLIYRSTMLDGQANIRDPNALPRIIAETGELLPEEKRNIAVFKRVAPSVVFITSLVDKDDFFRPNPTDVKTGSGTGFVWNRKGHIVTNFHVLQLGKATKWRVTLANEKNYFATRVGESREKDLAVLWIDAPASELTPIPVGTSTGLQVGQRVYAIGNPFGFDHSLTTGIISALNRETRSPSNIPIVGVIQIDAAINPGNSGGPLLDSSGRLIGVNTAIYSETGSSVGIGFAVPVDYINDIVPQLIRTGKYDKPGLSILIQTGHSSKGRYRGKPGVFFTGFAPGTSAAKDAGLIPSRFEDAGTRRERFYLGDLIVAIDSYQIRTWDDLFKSLTAYRVGQKVVLKILRKNKFLKVTIVLRPVSGN